MVTNILHLKHKIGYNSAYARYGLELYTKRGVFKSRQSSNVIEIYPRLALVAMVTTLQFYGNKIVGF